MRKNDQRKALGKGINSLLPSRQAPIAAAPAVPAPAPVSGPQLISMKPR